MITVELTFDDDPRRLAARPAHRARLTELHAAGTLVTAGPWADDSGALLVFDTDRSEVAGRRRGRGARVAAATPVAAARPRGSAPAASW